MMTEIEKLGSGRRESEARPLPVVMRPAVAANVVG